MSDFHPSSFMRGASILALVIALAGCEVGPDYQTPETKLPQNWISAADQKAADDQATTDQSWWQNFHDPVLTQLIEKAAAGNLDLKIAEARIAEARANRSAAVSSLLPQGDVKGTGNRQANQLAFPGGNQSGLSNLLHKPFNTFETGFDASWELDLFGRNRRQLESATAEVEASEASRDDVLVTMLAEVARTYLDIRQYQAQLDVTENTLKSDRNSLKIAKERFDVGDTAHFDVTQAEAQTSQEQTQLPYYRNLLAQSEYSLDVLLGEQPGTTHAIVAKKAPIPVSDKKVVLGAPASVIANRPDIRIAERKLASATAQQGVAVAKFFPDISLTGFIGLLNTNASDLFTAGSKSWMVGGQVMWPILSYGTLSANLDAANAQQQEALANYQKTIIGALSDVERSLTSYTERQNYLESLEKSVADNRHANDIARERYKEGLTSFIDVLDSERSLYTSESQLAQARAEVSEDLVAIYKSLGGGWTPAAPAPKDKP